ncbi:SGNH hydrolase domain-containing protein [Pseudomonas sp. GXZC]|uniref:SGNH hydrolase domain-containing protein n=1 Tax=Pseudomonas sp. GXZC TaxID=3003351 RepID=UPI0022AA0AE6|nr:SGNH hydrolase domain-containing protein [Pseudomonas sp. GXZC]WAT32294.1 SGNH hydrolase domain-containing protein [Pseudomonas sp. GXZC]
MPLESHQKRTRLANAAIDTAAAQCHAKIIDPAPYLCPNGHCLGSKMECLFTSTITTWLILVMNNYVDCSNRCSTQHKLFMWALPPLFAGTSELTRCWLAGA